MSFCLERFELRAFGPFTDVALALGESPAGALQIVCGPNEAGKSTARRAIGDFLFGIPDRSSDNQRHRHSELRLAAVLIDGDGTRCTLVRRKGRKGTLLDERNDPVDEGEDLLARLLGGIDRGAFEQMFSLTAETLQDGAQALLCAEGELGEALFGAVMGARSLRRLRAQSEQLLDDLWRPRKAKSKVNLRLAELKQARERLRQESLNGGEYERVERELSALRKRREKLTADVAGLRAREREIDRLRNVIPMLAGRKQALSELGQLAPHLIGDEALLGCAAEIDRLQADLEGMREAERQRCELLEQRALATARAHEAVARINPQATLAQAPSLLPDADRRRELEELLRRRGELEALIDQAQRDAAAAAQRAEELEARLAEMPASPSVGELEIAVEQARRPGDLERQLEQATERCKRAQAALRDTLQALSPALRPEALQAVHPPSPATIELFVEREEELANRERELASDQRRLSEERGALEEQRGLLVLEGTVPTLEQLSDARGERDRRWSAIRDRLEGRAAHPCPPEDYEQSVKHADDLADELRKRAELVARRERLALQGDLLKRRAAELEERQRALCQERTQLHAQWRGAWRLADVEPLSPREMLSWHKALCSARERATELEHENRETEVLELALQRERTALAAALRNAGVLHGEESLSALLARAQALIDEARGDAERRAQLVAELDGERRAASRERGLLEGHRAKLADWQGRWSQLIESVGWPTGSGCAQAERLLEAAGELGEALRTLRELDRRLQQLEDRLRRLGREADELAAALAPELATADPKRIVGELCRRLLEARRRRDRTSELEERIAEFERGIVEAGQAPLGELERSADERDRIALDAERDAIDAKLRECEGQLAEVVERCGRLDGERERMESAEGAAQAAAVVEQVLAELRPLAHDYARALASFWLLREAIDEYRRQNRDPLLQRAEVLFASLSAGSFASLEVDFDERDRPVLVGVRATAERVTVEHMSDGTREQLYLSLRLASIQQHVRRHGPMPVILDDVVLRSDPRRRRAILAALGELSALTQVIVFTHDPGLVALAREQLGDGRVWVQALSDDGFLQGEGARTPAPPAAAPSPAAPSPQPRRGSDTDELPRAA